jgi:hypothetical protein
MATATQWYLHGILLPSGSWISQLTDLTPATSTAHLSGYASGAVVPSFRAAQGIKPQFTFSTPQIATVLTACGLTGVGYAANNADLYFRKSSNLGSRVAIVTAEHQRLRAVRFLLYWTRITASQDGEARIECRLVPTFDGTNAPLVPAGSVAVPAYVTASEFYTLGPVAFNGSAVADVAEWSLDLGVQMREKASAGEDFLSFCGVQSHDPVLTCTTGDASWWVSPGLSGLQLTAAAFYLRRRQADQSRCYADGSAQHIKFSAVDNPCGLLTVEQSGGAGAEPASVSLRAGFRIDAATDQHPLSVDTASAIT